MVLTWSLDRTANRLALDASLHTPRTIHDSFSPVNSINMFVVIDCLSSVFSPGTEPEAQGPGY